ncbi:putative gastrointestinal growth factor xP4 [Engystomops pustulosus]|uniref:putative gastrointestinal growth factor xP4 n=1 Tax=Engystomops pustulosus TaxID=76066 RepID=UPI003AFB72AB
MGRLTVCWVVAILILGADAAYLPVEYMCDVQPDIRNECGYKGITRDECMKKKNCCYDNSIPDSIWCYSPWTPKVTRFCNVMSKEKVDCGFPGISIEECFQRDCCYGMFLPNSPLCYFPEVKFGN